MKFNLELEGVLNTEKMFYEGDLKAEEKLLLIFLNYKRNIQKKEELDLTELQEGCKESITEMLFRLQLKGYVKVAEGKIVVSFKNDGNKICTRCNLDKPLEDFNKGTDPLGKDAYCKTCRAELSKEYRDEQDPEERRAYERIYKAKKNLEGRIERLKNAVNDMVRDNKDLDIATVCLRANMLKETIDSYPELAEIIEKGRERLLKIRQAQREAEERRRNTIVRMDARTGIIESVEVKEPAKVLSQAITQESYRGVPNNFDEMEKKDQALELLKAGNWKQKEISEYVGLSQPEISRLKKLFTDKGLL